MQKVSLRKLSVLGLVLMVASAVTAAIIPSKSISGDNNAQLDTNGSLTESFAPGNVLTCTPTDGEYDTKPCHDSRTGISSETSDASSQRTTFPDNV